MVIIIIGNTLVFNNFSLNGIYYEHYFKNLIINSLHNKGLINFIIKKLYAEKLNTDYYKNSIWILKNLFVINKQLTIEILCKECDCNRFIIHLLEIYFATMRKINNNNVNVSRIVVSDMLQIVYIYFETDNDKNLIDPYQTNYFLSIINILVEFIEDFISDESFNDLNTYMILDLLLIYIKIKNSDMIPLLEDYIKNQNSINARLCLDLVDKIKKL